MWMLFAAVATSSLLGSLHCVGMCGPLALWASGASERHDRPKIVLATACYHLGRLVIYAVLGAVAGAVGMALDLGGDILGMQLVAARVVGAAMIVVGGWALWHRVFEVVRPARVAAPKALTPSIITRVIQHIRPHVFRLPLVWRGAACGGLTALLPCGWLYLFALVAAGTGDMVQGALLMAAFWVGTVPLLTALVAGAGFAQGRFQRAVPAVAAGLLVVAGSYTAAGRGLSELNAWSDIKTAFAVPPQPAGESALPVTPTVELQRHLETPLPCCQHAPPPDGAAEPQQAP